MGTLREILGYLAGLSKETYVGWSLVPIASGFLWALIKADHGEASKFKLIHFVTNDAGRGSKEAFAYTALAVVSVWTIWATTVLGTLTEWLVYGVLGAFVSGAAVATWTKYKARAAGAHEPEPDAGDMDAEPKPALERETLIRQTERVPAENPLDPPKGGK